MSKPSTNWYIPAEFILLLTIPCVAVLGAVLLPVVERLKMTDVGKLYDVAVGAGIVGVAILFLARLPLYRDRRFLTFGPTQLDRKHRRLNWLAYGFVSISLFMLWIVWLRAHES